MAKRRKYQMDGLIVLCSTSDNKLHGYKINCKAIAGIEELIRIAARMVQGSPDYELVKVKYHDIEKEFDSDEYSNLL